MSTPALAPVVYRPSPEERLVAAIYGRKHAVDLNLGDWVTMTEAPSSDPRWRNIIRDGYAFVLNSHLTRGGDVRLYFRGAPPIDYPAHTTLDVPEARFCVWCEVDLDPTYGNRLCLTCRSGATDPSSPGSGPSVANRSSVEYRPVDPAQGQHR